MTNTDPVVLICTVGGSPQPILTAIRQLHPVFVEFLCTDKDPGTGQPGSCICISGKGMVCKSGAGVKQPDLPSIPAMAKLSKEKFGVTIVLSDDLDPAFLTIRNKLLELSQRFPLAAIVADYTGGTKTMTAALVTAALETDGINLQLVTGNRPDLVKVKNGTQSVVASEIDRFRYQKAARPFIESWKRFAYDEAVKGLSNISPPADHRLRAEYFRLKDMSAAFAAWDRFNHGEALRLLEDYGPSAGVFLSPYLAALRILTTEDEKQVPLQILDLWQNALRRAARGRFDDAMGRCYRLIEWTAQWLLKKYHGVDTGDLPAGFVPETVMIDATGTGKLKAGLMNAWELIRLKHDGPAKEFIDNEQNRLKDLIQVRNRSILAHGISPIDQFAWGKMADWMEKTFVPMLLGEARAVRIRTQPPQLPVDAELTR